MERPQPSRPWLPRWAESARYTTVAAGGAGTAAIVDYGTPVGTAAAGIVADGRPPVGRVWPGHVPSTLATASYSARVTHRWYWTLTATCWATYSQRNALSGGN